LDPVYDVAVKEPIISQLLEYFVYFDAKQSIDIKLIIKLLNKKYLEPSHFDDLLKKMEKLEVIKIDKERISINSHSQNQIKKHLNHKNINNIKHKLLTVLNDEFSFESESSLSLYSHIVYIRNTTNWLDEVNVRNSEIFNKLGRRCFISFQFEKAIEFYLISLEMKSKIYPNKVHKDIATILNNIGSIYKHLNQFDKALEYFEESLRMFIVIHQANDHFVFGAILKNIGLIYNELNQFNNALIYFEESLRIFKSVYSNNDNNFYVADSFFNLGWVHHSLNNYEEALQNYMNSLKVINAINKSVDSVYLGLLLKSIGSIYSKLNDNYKALNYFYESLRVFKNVYQHKYNLHSAAVLNNIALVYNELNDFDKAMEYFDEATRIKIFLNKN
jgi:tetratricopeptide (TPR) repeat protein